ncbi:hypothetical protein ACFL08_04890 [Patescibacteria group bacterium]
MLTMKEGEKMKIRSGMTRKVLAVGQEVFLDEWNGKYGSQRQPIDTEELYGPGPDESEYDFCFLCKGRIVEVIEPIDDGKPKSRLASLFGPVYTYKVETGEVICNHSKFGDGRFRVEVGKVKELNREDFKVLPKDCGDRSFDEIGRIVISLDAAKEIFVIGDVKSWRMQCGDKSYAILSGPFLKVEMKAEKALVSVVTSHRLGTCSYDNTGITVVEVPRDKIKALFSTFGNVEYLNPGFCE